MVADDASRVSYADGEWTSLPTPAPFSRQRFDLCTDLANQIILSRGDEISARHDGLLVRDLNSFCSMRLSIFETDSDIQSCILNYEILLLY